MGFTAPIYESPRAKEKPPYQQFPGGSAQTLRSEMTRLRNSPSMQAMSIDSAGSEREKQSGWLDWIERVGNRLPHPMSLFIIGAVAVLVLSQIADWGNWSAEKTVLQEDPGGTTAKVVVEVTARGLLMGDGAFWTIDSLVKNFTGFAPLGVVLVGMLGIGVAERSGAIGALLKVGMLITPARLLTPAMIFIGILSSMGLDAGYVVLPPIAAALYKSVGRSPLVGLAAAFVGVSAGFSANLFITGLDPMLAELSSEGAQILDSGRSVAATANLWFMITSTIVLTLVGWGVTAWIVEPRYSSSVLTGGSSTLTEEDLRARTITPEERRGLKAAGVVLSLFLIVLLSLILPEGAPLSGKALAPYNDFDRWVKAIVPLLLFCFLLPGIAYGIAARNIRNDHDVAKMMGKTMADMGPYIVLAFFAAQFVAFFKESNLGEMMALSGGKLLATASLPSWLLIVGFIVLVMFANLFIGSASAKYGFLGPVFVPMFMQGASISPELTQAAYRVGDSCSNIITPLNPYMVIILVFMQKYMPKGGIGTLIALMLPYALVFAVVWTALLVLWMMTGIDLGPQGPLEYNANL